MIAPSQLNFANVQAGDTSPMLSFEVENVGTDICLVQDLGIQNDADGRLPHPLDEHSSPTRHQQDHDSGPGDGGRSRT